MNQSSQSSKTIWVVDMDFTTLDSERVFESLSRLLERAGIVDAVDLSAMRKEVEASGGTFDVTSHLSRQLGVSDERLDAISSEFGDNQSGEQYLYDDVAELFQVIRERGDQFVTLTYGSERTQMLKLRASGLVQYPFVITDSKLKGDSIRNWKQADGSYRLVTAAGELIVGSTGVLVDDKSSSFDNLPDDWRGYRVWRGQPRLSQRGKVPAEVVTVTGLNAITRSLRTA
jgi:predicted phosphatase